MEEGKHTRKSHDDWEVLQERAVSHRENGNCYGLRKFKGSLERLCAVRVETVSVLENYLKVALFEKQYNINLWAYYYYLSIINYRFQRFGDKKC